MGLQGQAALKLAAIREQGVRPPRMLYLMLTLPITGRRQSLISFIVETATAGHKTSSTAASLLTPPFLTIPQGTALPPPVTLRPKLTPPTGRGQTRIRIPPMTLLTRVSPWIRRTPVALSVTRPKVPVQARCLALRVASLSLLPMLTAVRPDVTLAAQVRFTNPIMLKPVCTARMQETTWPFAKSATEPQALLTLMGVSHPPVAPTPPAIPMPGPIPLIGRGKMTQRRIIDPATATQETRATPAPSATISLKADQHLIQPRPAASQTTSEGTNVMREARATMTTTDLYDRNLPISSRWWVIVLSGRLSRNILP